MIIESKIAVNCHHFILLKHVKRINSYLESFTVFSRKIFRWCLTFDAVYTYSIKNVVKMEGLLSYIDYLPYRQTDKPLFS